MAAWYFPILWTHIGCAVASGTLFAFRGGAALLGLPLPNRGWLRGAAVGIDTALLAAGIALCLILQEYPFAQSWLTAVVVLLLAYIALGAVALRARRGRGMRGACFVAALVVFGLIVGIAYTQSAWGVFAPLGA